MPARPQQRTPPQKRHACGLTILHPSHPEVQRVQHDAPRPPSVSTTQGHRAPLRRRPAQRSITLRHLLIDTAGFSDAIWEAKTVRDVQATARPVSAIGHGVCPHLGRC